MSPNFIRKLQNLSPVAFYTGRVMLLLAEVMVIPLLTSVLFREIQIVLDFLVGISITCIVGFSLLLISGRGSRDISWSQGMIVVSLSWLFAMMLSAIPYYLSGYWKSYLDAMFDVMSGFTTTGLVLGQDLDHMPYGINMWRHLLTWIGGQGIIVLALSFFTQGSPGAFKIYVGEGKDERLQPNVINTARAIWYVSIVYLFVGTFILWITGIFIGLPVIKSLFHGLWIFMAAWSTGGFAPQSQNIIYYHSRVYEIISMIFFIIGSFNFNLHWAIWTGNRKEIYKNLETVTFSITATVLSMIAIWELFKLNVYPNAISLLSRGYYSILSAHTTTGFSTIYARQFVLEWGPLALMAITVAMLFGGSASSTAGGFKAVRVGVAFKTVIYEIKRLVAPERAVIVEKIHMGRDIVLEDRYVRIALTIIFLYTIFWIILTFITNACGYDLPSSMFESASALGNVGLSCGVTSPTMPSVLKIAYIIGMWIGRLEFMAVFVFIMELIRIFRR
ncbi:MAG: TrkH family potassium uptake protein [bacterium]